MKHIKYCDTKSGVSRERVILTRGEQYDLIKRNREFITCNKLDEITAQEWRDTFNETVSFSDEVVQTATVHHRGVN